MDVHRLTRTRIPCLWENAERYRLGPELGWGIGGQHSSDKILARRNPLARIVSLVPTVTEFQTLPWRQSLKPEDALNNFTLQPPPDDGTIAPGYNHVIGGGPSLQSQVPRRIRGIRQSQQDGNRVPGWKLCWDCELEQHGIGACCQVRTGGTPRQSVSVSSEERQGERNPGGQWVVSGPSSPARSMFASGLNTKRLEPLPPQRIPAKVAVLVPV